LLYPLLKRCQPQSTRGQIMNKKISNKPPSGHSGNQRRRHLRQRLETLVQALEKRYRVYVVAPEAEQSAVGHSLT